MDAFAAKLRAFTIQWMERLLVISFFFMWLVFTVSIAGMFWGMIGGVVGGIVGILLGIPLALVVTIIMHGMIFIALSMNNHLKILSDRVSGAR
ncbi:MAG: hypothetical protein IT557_05625 [Alphaproteobacteria bacterium]|nr:hypothetical protein [Alphaproteobacteria bacterium]